jgi:hypothetical protein
MDLLMEIPLCYCHNGGVDKNTNSLLDSIIITILYGKCDNKKADKLMEDFTNHQIPFCHNEIWKGIVINQKILIIKVFIENEVGIIDQILSLENLYTFTKYIHFYMLACRYSNINTISYFSTQKRCSPIEHYIISNEYQNIINFVVERTDDSVEILDTIVQSINNIYDCDFNTMIQARDIALECGNIKMAQYLNDFIAKN